LSLYADKVEGMTTVKVVMFAPTNGQRYVKPVGQMSYSYGCLDWTEGAWRPFCFDCVLGLPPAAKVRGATLEIIDHRRQVHGDQLKLIRRWHPFRTY
jgi:hypothetical protein